MARQNVGNPKFYIDLPSYWRAMGNISNVTHNGVTGNNAEKLIGLNPSDFFDEQVVVDYYSYWQFKIGMKYATFLVLGLFLNITVGACVRLMI